ncbi:Vesicle-associated membrane protein [Forsythia ovata]|uniref:Vesicle-associated membrane protein n=1 Tax=Forsythia ovata TaxID=205694 RepID=A0ABD1X2H1_9LAMI
MAILYEVVARGTFVLSEFNAVTENAPAVVRRILEKLSEADHAESRLCFSHDQYIFHILRSDGLTFFCMANDTFGRIESVAMDPKDKKLTVIGDIDPVSLVDKLRKICQTGIVSVGPAKEPEKNKEQPKPDDKNKDYMSEYLKAYQEYYKQQQQHYYNYYTPSKHYAQPAESTYYAASVGVEENPNSCGELQNGRVNPAGEAAVEFPGDAERVGWVFGE